MVSRRNPPQPPKGHVREWPLPPERRYECEHGAYGGECDKCAERVQRQMVAYAAANAELAAAKNELMLLAINGRLGEPKDVGLFRNMLATERGQSDPQTRVWLVRGDRDDAGALVISSDMRILNLMCGRI